MSAARPRRLVVVAGTATEIGKTWVSAALASSMVADGWVVAARKPAQSGGPGDGSDADLLAGATGEDPTTVCPEHRRYSVPMAPPMAAEVLGLDPPTLADLAGEVARSWGVRSADVGIVELAGGVASPAAGDGDGADLAAAVSPDGIVLVADAGLGTINAVRLSAAHLESVTGFRPIVHLNRFDPDDDLHRRNLAWLVDRDDLVVTSDIYALTEWVVGLAPDFCGFCGRATTECERACVRPLDPDHFCVRCGRRLVVSVSPTRHSARCKVHGTNCA